jgi:hypothetical protein
VRASATGVDIRTLDVHLHPTVAAGSAGLTLARKYLSH